MKNVCALIVLFVIYIHHARAVASGFGPAQSKVVRIIDGDTIKMRVAIWIDQELLISVRIAGIDAPEIFRPKCQQERTKAVAAKLFVEEFLSSHTAIILYDIQRDKYGGRVVARIETEKGDLGAALVAAKLAVVGQKGNWCG